MMTSISMEVTPQADHALQDQVKRFFSALFGQCGPRDYLLIRPIETWTEGGRKKSAVDHKGVQYSLLGNIEMLGNVLRRHAERGATIRTNIFFGVCPRFGAAGKFDLAWQIRVVRALWADVDHCGVEEALQRCEAAGLPRASVVVNSGNGVHLYWLLDTPYLIDDVSDPPPVFTEFIDQGEGQKKKPRKFLKGADGQHVYIDGKGKQNAPPLSAKAQHIQDILSGIASKIGGDHTTDLSRILRVPGTLNRKDERNGREPVPCVLLECASDRRYPLSDFEQFAQESPGRKHRDTVAKVRLPARRRMSAGRQDKFHELLAACDLAQPGARSEADFALCCFAVEYGMTSGEVWAEVQHVGKFAQEGERYFLLTWEKAENHAREKICRRVQSRAAKSPAGRNGDHRGQVHVGIAVPPLDTDAGRTEAANAKRLVALRGADFRWCEPFGRFHVWTGARWEADPKRIVERFAKEVYQNLWTEIAGCADVSDDELAAMIRFVRSTGTARAIDAMLRLARSEPGIPVVPDELDQDVWLLNCPNGTLDLRTGELRPHRREDLITKLCPVPFDKNASAPIWEATITRCLANNQRLITFVQRLFGWWSTGDVSEQILPIFYGLGANGKSLLVNTYLDCLGPDYAMKAAPDLLIEKGDSHPTERADLFGRRFVAAIETDEGRRLAEGLIKELCGGDRVRARFMRQDFFEFRPTHKVLLACNHKPVVRGSDYAIWRRLRIVPFTVVIPPAEQDKALPVKLRRELPGILAWCVRGCLDWQAHGLDAPEEVEVATEGYRSEQDWLGEFLRACCVEHPSASAKAADLLNAYVAWSGDKAMTPKRLGASLRERGFTDARTEKARLWKGIGLLADGWEA